MGTPPKPPLCAAADFEVPIYNVWKQMTFVDFAELIWKRTSEGQTQQQVADAIGWSPEKTAKHDQLRQIAPEAWEIICTTFRDNGAVRREGDVQDDSTGVQFTENLLRALLPRRWDAIGWSREKVAQHAQLQKIDAEAWSVVTTSVRGEALPADDEVTDVVTTVTFGVGNSEVRWVDNLLYLYTQPRRGAVSNRDFCGNGSPEPKPQSRRLARHRIRGSFPPLKLRHGVLQEQHLNLEIIQQIIELVRCPVVRVGNIRR